MPAVQVAKNILQFVRSVHVKYVAVCLNFYRNKLIKSTMSVEVYNYKVACLNAILECWQVNSGFLFWKHKGFQFSKVDILSHDGCHLNSIGSEKFFRSLRGLIVYFANQNI